MRTVQRSPDPFTSLAVALAEWPSLVQRVLAAHPARRSGNVCPGCSMPGGRTRISAPCGPRNVALLAQRIATRGQS